MRSWPNSWIRLFPWRGPRSERWAEENAMSRFSVVWQKVQEVDHPALYNAAYELFSDTKRTPRERLRAMEFRVRTFEEELVRDSC